METNSQQPAFPIQPTFNNEGQICNERYAFEGLTKREYMATRIIQGLLSNPNTASQIVGSFGKVSPEEANKVVSITAVRITDELIEQLSAVGEKI